MVDTPSFKQDGYLTGLKLLLVLGSLTMVTFLVLLDTAIVGTAIPRITSEFGKLQDTGWYIGAYMLASATLQPLSGKLYTHFSNKYTYLSFTILFEIGSLICGVAPSSTVFIIGRAVAGLGAAGIINGGLTIISGVVPLKKSPMYTGVLLGVAQMGIVTGPLIGGALTEHVSWRWCFYINLPIGGAAALFFLFVQIPELTEHPSFSLELIRKVLPDLDLFGFALFAPAAVMFLLALQLGSGDSYTWGSSIVVGLMCGAGVTASAFIAWEFRMGDRAMIPGAILQGRIVWTSCVYGTILTCTGIIGSNWIPTFFQAVKGKSPTLSGINLLPNILSQLFLIVISGAAITRFGRYTPWALFGGTATVIGSVLVSTWTSSTTTGQWIGYQILFGAGRGAGTQMAFIAVQNAVQPNQIPLTSAILIFFQNFGSSVAGVLANVIFTETIVEVIPRYAHSVSPQDVLNAGSGAAAVRSLVPEGHDEEVEGVLRAYSESLRNVFYFVTGLAALAVFASLGMGWKDIHKQKTKTTPTEKEDVDVRPS